MFNSGNIQPFWNIDEFKALEYTPSTHKDIELIDRYKASGHYVPSIYLSNYFEPNPMPDCVFNYILPYFDLENVAVAINHFSPGTYLPMHVDLFQKYIEVKNVKYDDITRIVVMLEDSSNGQISQVCNETFGIWKAGDWFQWDAIDQHAFYNLSMVDRYAIQITGTRPQKNCNFNLVVDNTR